MELAGLSRSGRVGLQADPPLHRLRPQPAESRRRSRRWSSEVNGWFDPLSLPDVQRLMGWGDQPVIRWDYPDQLQQQIKALDQIVRLEEGAYSDPGV